ncbi:MAG: hypothetical protein KDJ65_00320 [Anaerolineae bacterium]|nr:hypothetical protein [Anaerolineae bacterium]
MKRATHQRLNLITSLSLAAGLAGAIAWNLATIFIRLEIWWPALVLPVPGLAIWIGLVTLSALSGRKTTPHPHSYRLLYSSPPGWEDARVRQALLTLLKSGTGLDIIWAKDGTASNGTANNGGEIGCWLTIAGYRGVLERLVRDVFPNGAVEASDPPEIGPGIVILHWQQAAPAPVELCKQAGIDGVYYRWVSEKTAIVAIWGPATGDVAQQLAQPEDVLTGQGSALLSPKFSGDNPWPTLPPFPQTDTYPGLSVVSTLVRSAPTLRLNGQPALKMGQDSEAQPVGFALPDLDGLQLLYITGQATERVVINMVQQAVQARRPVLLLDGQGVVTTRLARRLLRAVATERVLLCDVERPAQSRFRLNPLWLPEAAETRVRALSLGWPAWLREQGVTAAGLGLAAFRHTQVAVMLTALVAQERGLTLDVPGLCEALHAPDFLKLVDPEIWAGCGLLDDDLWDWWQREGRLTSTFDMHLRLAHLRDRLNALLDLPEYSVLWRGPYLEPLAALGNGQSLFWRLPDPRRRLPAYIISQLLALNTLLTAWSEVHAPVIFLHELQTEGWLERLTAFPNVRLVLSSARAKTKPGSAQPSSLLLSRLDEVPAWVQQSLPDIRPTDLKRLPPNRLLLKCKGELCTVDFEQ